MRAPATFTEVGAIKLMQQERDAQRRREAFRLSPTSDEHFDDVARRVGLTPPKRENGPLLGLTWQQAEHVACDWMKLHGYKDARVTAGGADGGIDIRSSKAIAQVKHHKKPVGISEMQRIHGIAVSLRKKALFFSASGYTPKAAEWACRHKIECYTYPPVKRVKG